MTELKRCPFCGHEGILTRNDGGYTVVACRACDAEGPIGNTAEEDIELWNTRVDDKPAQI